MERQYKDSGIEWIGNIPTEWKMQPLSIYFTENNKPNSNLESVNALQFKYGEIIQKPNNGKELNEKDCELLSKYTMVVPNDIVVNGLNLNYDLKSLRIAKVRENGIITSAYIVLRSRNGANAAYYNYYLKALDFQKIFHGMGVGIRLTLSYNELRPMLLPVPSVEEQCRIANFLDKKCGEIDELIEVQELMIQKLTDYKQSVITEAVTKGLNPNTRLVPSGIDWIGDIPEGWKLMKTLYTLKMPLTDGPHETPELFADGVPFISADAVSDGFINFENQRGFISEDYYKECCKKYIPQIYDVYMIKSGASTGKTAIVETDRKFTIWSPLAVYRANDRIIEPYFLLYSLRSYYYQMQVQDNWSYGTQQNIGMRTLEKLFLIVPSIEEQREILSHLNTKCSEIDSLITLKQQKIEKLKDYKKSVIYEAVTGKMDI